MIPFRVEAPGKVVLVGEYAVVDGAPAVVAAVDRGVCCEVSEADARIIETPGDARFADAALAGAAPARYRFSDWNPVDLTSKPGLGGSAAATVAGVLAAAVVAGDTPSPDVLQARATAVHRAVQGSGSGIDVAASAHGGVIRFERGAVTPARTVDPVVIWSGRSASTGPRLARYQAWSGRERFAERSAAMVERFVDDPVDALREATALLDAMSSEAGVDWWTDALRAIHILATEHGGAAKPSGAGGGDVAVALFEDFEARSAFVAACNDAGFAVIPTRIAPGAAVRR